MRNWKNIQKYIELKTRGLLSTHLRQWHLRKHDKQVRKIALYRPR